MKNTIKKIVPILLAGIMLAGCGIHLDKLSDVEVPTLPAEETPVIATAEPANAEPVPSEEATQAIASTDTMVMVSIKNQTEEYYDPAEGTQLILTFGYDSPRVTIEGQDETASDINEYVAMLEDTWYTGNDYGAGTAAGRDMMLEMATDNFTYVYESGDTSDRLDMAASRTVNIKRADGSAISYLFHDYIYAGAGQETNSCLAVNFDTRTGKLLSFADVAADQGAEAFLISTIIDGKTEGANLASALSTAIENGQWYFTQEGVTVFLQPAEAEAADSLTEYSVSYEELKNCIKAQFIPQAESCTGSVSIISLSDYQENTAEIVDRVVADENGTDFLLQVQGTVYNLKLAQVDYSNNGFYETAELWFCNIITDASVQVCTVIPEGMPNLKVSYTEDGTEHICYISESGQDGHPFLSENIQAIG